MIRTVVVDDEKLARERVKGFLRKVGDVQVVGEAEDSRAAIEVLEREQPDLVVLDIQMPGGDGFGVIRALKEPPHVIFATAYDEYAIKAFEVEALDYLLKPFSQARLLEAVDRIRRKLGEGMTRPDTAAIERPPSRTARTQSRSRCTRRGRSWSSRSRRSSGSRSSPGSSTRTSMAART
jgi:YesN/AraC family two-component response regulator